MKMDNLMTNVLETREGKSDPSNGDQDLQSASPRQRLSSSRGRVGSLSTLSKKACSLPNETVEYLKAWMMSPEHISHPYPTDAEKAIIMQETGIELKQLTNWFVNNRKRFWKPRVAKLQEQIQALPNSSSGKNSTPEISEQPKGTTDPALRWELPRSVSIGNTAALVTEDEHSNIFTTVCYDLGNENCPHESLLGNAGSTSSSDLSNLADISNDTPTKGSFYEHTSVISLADSGSVSHQCSDDDSSSGIGMRYTERYCQKEFIDIHILRPSSNSTIPQLCDVTSLPYVPPERILYTFKNCSIVYRLKVEPENVDNCDLISAINAARDLEIDKTKRNCLSSFIQKLGAETISPKVQVHCSFTSTSGHTESENLRCRKRTDNMNRCNSVVSLKRQRVNEDFSQNTSNPIPTDLGNDETPSLDDAAQLFGFAQAVRKNYSEV